MTASRISPKRRSPAYDDTCHGTKFFFSFASPTFDRVREMQAKVEEHAQIEEKTPLQLKFSEQADRMRRFSQDVESDEHARCTLTPLVMQKPLACVDLITK